MANVKFHNTKIMPHEQRDPFEMQPTIEYNETNESYVWRIKWL